MDTVPPQRIEHKIDNPKNYMVFVAGLIVFKGLFQYGII
jgi:hypothetical protein